MVWQKGGWEENDYIEQERKCCLEGKGEKGWEAEFSIQNSHQKCTHAQILRVNLHPI